MRPGWPATRPPAAGPTRPPRSRRRARAAATRRAALDQLDDQRVHRALDGHAAGLALALAVVPVADGEQRALDVHAQVDRRPGAHLRGVHVAAERVGHQRVAHLAAGRRDPDGAVHGCQRQLDAQVAPARLEQDGAAPGRAGRSRSARAAAPAAVRCGRCRSAHRRAGSVVDAAQSRAGVRSTRCSASVSPGSAPSTKNGPVCGLTSAMSSTSDGRSVGRRRRPENASSVHNLSTVPGLIRCVGATPPKVHAYCPGSGRNSTSST